MSFVPAGWTGLENGIAAWLSAASIENACLWGWANDDKRPEMPFPYVLAQVTSPPSHTFHAGLKVRLEAVVIRTAAVQTYTLHLASGDVSYLALLTDTVTMIRDALLLLVPGSTAIGVDTLVLPGSATLVQALPVEPEPAILPKIVNRRQSRGNCTIQIDANAVSDSAAFALALAIESSIETDHHRETLLSAGWGFVRISGSRSLPSYVDGAWRGRASFDLILSCRYEIDEVIDYIESAAIRSIDSSGGALTGEVWG